MDKFKVILAYSGGLDTSIMITWLKENYDCEVITVTCDVGQGEDFEAVKEKALKSGALKAYIIDCREEFVVKYLWPLLQAGAVYDNEYLLGTVSRPLIAEKLADIAEKEQASYISHGATGKGNDQVRFELTIKALAPHLKVIAPWREWEIKSRTEAMEYAKKHSIPVTATKDSPYSRDQNLWYVSHEGGVLESTTHAHPNDLYLMTKAVELASETAEEIVIKFVEGIPTAINDQAMSSIDIMLKLNELGGKHGIGIIDIIENRLVGMKVRGVYEFPGATILYKAHKTLETLCLDRETLHFKNSISQKYANLVYDGKWFCSLKQALDSFIKQTQKNITGEVKLKLYKGQCYFAGAQSPFSLYDKNFATFEEEEVYNQRDAQGFINLFGLPMKIQAMKQGKHAGSKK